MTPTNHTLTLLNRFNNFITAPVVRVKDLGNGIAEVDVETNYHIEVGHEHPATYATPSREAWGMYVASGREFTERMTYVYKGEFRRVR